VRRDHKPGSVHFFDADQLTLSVKEIVSPGDPQKMGEVWRDGERHSESSQLPRRFVTLAVLPVTFEERISRGAAEDNSDAGG